MGSCAPAQPVPHENGSRDSRGDRDKLHAVRAVSKIVRVRTECPWVAVAAVVLGLALWSGCAASPPPPKPAPPDPIEEIVAALTKALKLDVVQQRRTRELLKELSDRNDTIRAGWSKGQRVRPRAFVDSRGQFERDFVAILTQEQRQVFFESRTRLMLRAKILPS